MQMLLTRKGVSRRTQTWCLCVWLFSPFTVTISTRGNGEALVTCMLLAMLALLETGGRRIESYYHFKLLHFVHLLLFCYAFFYFYSFFYVMGRAVCQCWSGVWSGSALAGVSHYLRAAHHEAPCHASSIWPS